MILTRTIGAAALLSLLVACASPAEKAAAYVAKAQKLYDAGDYEQAGLEIRNAVQVEPKNAKARYLMALLAEQKEDFKGMFNGLLVAVDADPSNIEARLKLGMVFIAIGDWVHATEQSDALQKLAPEDARVVLLQARVDLQNGKLTAARTGLEKSIQLDPANSDPVLILGAFTQAPYQIVPGEFLVPEESAVLFVVFENADPTGRLRLPLFGFDNGPTYTFVVQMAAFPAGNLDLSNALSLTVKL